MRMSYQIDFSCLDILIYNYKWLAILISAISYLGKSKLSPRVTCAFKVNEAQRNISSVYHDSFSQSLHNTRIPNGGYGLT